jgi:ribose transport system permease protein
MSVADTLTRVRYRYFPDHVVGEVLSKRWADNAIAFVALVVVVSVFAVVNGRMFSIAQLNDLAGQMSEYGLVAIGFSIVMISGGIDLSVGSVFALCTMMVLVAMNVWQQELWLAALETLCVGALCGAINGILIGYFRLRAFLTTLITLISFRSVYDIFIPDVGTRIVLGTPNSAIWEVLGSGSVGGLPYSVLVAAVFALAFHVVLSRTRPGWHLAAVGGSRRSAFNAGINVRSVVFSAYMTSGILCAVAAILYGAQLGSIGNDTGVGLEMLVLTAVVVGGVSLGGGRGSVAKALMGSVTVLVLNNGLQALSIQGSTASMILGFVLLGAVFVDVRWVKNKNKLLNSAYVSPAFLKLPACPETASDSGSPFAVNDALRDVEAIGLGRVEGPEDPLIDRDGNVYSGNRQGDIVRFLAPDFRTMEVYAHTGGSPLGMNFDREGNLVVCIGGMGLYMVTPQREVVKLTDETNRSKFSIIDDSRLRLADDLDIAHDGRIFFSEASYRYSAHDWPVDCLESRGNGRLICYDPRDKSTRTVLANLIFPNGMCCTQDKESLLFAESWACRVNRYWFDGPKRGKVEQVLALPGYPDNINRASDGNYWVALVGMRGPSLDLALTMPAFRKRMTRQVAPANWLFPNINTGCVVKFTDRGEVLGTYWDLGGLNHPMVTSVKEHKGYLYLGGVSNNRLGKWKVPGADPSWTGPDSYWGPRS